MPKTPTPTPPHFRLKMAGVISLPIIVITASLPPPVADGTAPCPSLRWRQAPVPPVLAPVACRQTAAVPVACRLVVHAMRRTQWDARAPGSIAICIGSGHGGSYVARARTLASVRRRLIEIEHRSIRAVGRLARSVICVFCLCFARAPVRRGHWQAQKVFYDTLNEWRHPGQRTVRANGDSWCVL